MHDCCVRVTALLECFEWTLNKPHNRTGHGFNLAINAKRLGVDFWCYKCVKFKGRVPLTLDHYWYRKGGESHHASSYSYTQNLR